jgi:hypothetical protein
MCWVDWRVAARLTSTKKGHFYACAKISAVPNGLRPYRVMVTDSLLALQHEVV